MREIKFRAWDKAEGSWRYFDATYGMTHRGRFNRHHPLSNKFGDIMQYTGLKDKNGVEIYEGDIMTSNTVVRWNNRGCCFEVTGRDFTATVDYASRCYEIIGNIHQNPELINQV